MSIEETEAEILAILQRGNDQPSTNGRHPATATASDLPQPVNWAELFNRPITVEDWLVHDFWPAGRAISIVARAKGGKSLLMFYLCACLARGIDPWTHRPRPPVTVGYWDMEMTEDDLHERAIDFGLQPHELDRFKYYLLPTIPPIDTPEGGKAVADTMRRDQVQAAVFDTFGRVVQGDENLADTVNAYYRWTGLPLKVAGIASARLDHVGHTNTERARGSSGKGADIDVAWTLTRNDSESIVTLDHHGVTRVRWVPRTLIVEHTEGEPDRFHRAASAWPPGTQDLAGLLDKHQVPLDASVRKAMKTLREAGSGHRQDPIRAALNWRRTVGTHLGTHPFEFLPDTATDTPDEKDF